MAGLIKDPAHFLAELTRNSTRHIREMAEMAEVKRDYEAEWHLFDDLNDFADIELEAIDAHHAARRAATQIGDEGLRLEFAQLEMALITLKRAAANAADEIEETSVGGYVRPVMRLMGDVQQMAAFELAERGLSVDVEPFVLADDDSGIDMSAYSYHDRQRDGEYTWSDGSETAFEDENLEGSMAAGDEENDADGEDNDEDKENDEVVAAAQRLSSLSRLSFDGSTSNAMLVDLGREVTPSHLQDQARVRNWYPGFVL